MRTATQADQQQQATMQAIVQDGYGAAEDVLRLEEIDRPAVADTEVLLRVHAVGVDRGVWHLMTGLPFPVRLAGYGIRAPKTRVRGREVAGRVEAVGSAVTTLAIGDEVFGIAEGAFADYACAQPGKLAPGQRTCQPSRRRPSPFQLSRPCRPFATGGTCKPASRS